MARSHPRTSEHEQEHEDVGVLLEVLDPPGGGGRRRQPVPPELVAVLQHLRPAPRSQPGPLAERGSMSGRLAREASLGLVPGWVGRRRPPSRPSCALRAVVHALLHAVLVLALLHAHTLPRAVPHAALSAAAAAAAPFRGPAREGGQAGLAAGVLYCHAMPTVRHGYRQAGTAHDLPTRHNTGSGTPGKPCMSSGPPLTPFPRSKSKRLPEMHHPQNTALPLPSICQLHPAPAGTGLWMPGPSGTPAPSLPPSRPLKPPLPWKSG
jgi:hypothetical protein